ncbi:TOMM precursor leader peptide-binding protein [Micromonospora profundi]|uniref:TOMM precursor leader peptide-binding protein n=1 Tax=Micromonospora profundi TaxID=1420889 RepID=UPI0036BD965C
MGAASDSSTYGVRLLGTGVLHRAVETAVRPLPTDDGRGVDVFVADDRSDQVSAAARRARAAGRAFLPVYPTLRGVRIGPFTVAGRSGCHHCVQVRSYRARVGAAPHRSALWQGLYDGTVTAPAPTFGTPLRTVIAALVADELDRVAQGAAVRCDQAVLEVDTATLAISRHRLIAEPGCALCGDLPDDGPSAGDLRLVSRPKRTPDDYRSRSLHQEYESLTAATVDARIGLFSSVTVHHKDSMIVAEAVGGPVCCDELSGFGRAFTYPVSVSVAIAEALERLGGDTPRARRTSVRGSFAELGADRAIDPATLGVPRTPPDDRSVPYRPDQPLTWVYAYSFRRAAPVLVPETLAYYGSHSTGFGPENSNGCALGANLEEAILHGLFEVAERDAFLATWYARLPVPRIDPMSSASPRTRLLVRWLERTSGCELHAFDITMPEGLPAVWLMLVDDDARPGLPRVRCGAGAHLDPERALWSALVEIASFADATRAMVAADTTAPDLVADSDLVRTMEDHLFAAASPDSWPRFGFLYERREVLSMAAAFPPEGRYQPADDLLADLRHVVGRYLDAGFDVVAVDQTGREQEAVGLTSVKVLVPGLLPMSFGHRNRRVDLPRLRELPVRLGHRSRPLTPAEVNPYPHPFP